MHLPGPNVAGKYRVLTELGRGAMGVVYEAVHLTLGHRVALKFLADETAPDDPVKVARFLREARAAANIASEHIARVFDLDVTKGRVPFLVMELLEGDDLANVLHEQGPLPASEAVRYAIQLSAAVAEAHAIGIIHRDLKPENVFLQARRGGSPTVKVLDFGLAKAEHGVDVAKTAADIVFGTPLYMSPEQLRSASAAGPKADVWAIGVILHEMLTGARPFEGSSASEIVAAIASKSPDGIRKLRPDLPAALEAIVARCLSRDPELRPHAAELAEELLPFAPPGLEELVARTLATQDTEEWIDEGVTVTAAGRVLRGDDGSGDVIEAWGRREWALAAVIGLLLLFAGIGVSALTRH